MPNDQTPNRPGWLPDTQGFLAIAIVVLLAVVVMTLLWRERINLDQNTFGALLTLLGVLAGCFKDVYSWAFGSSKKEEKKDDALAAIAAAPVAPPLPPTTDDLARAQLNPDELAYYLKLTDEAAKRAFVAKSAAERAADMAKG